MERHSILDEPIDDTLLKLSNKNRSNRYLIMNGVSVKITSQRYAVFKNSITCVSCNVKGAFFAVERFSDGPYHLNLYAMKHGREVLMTKDHIIAKFNGGKNIVSNYQTMCSPCNRLKGCK